MESSQPLVLQSDTYLQPDTLWTALGGPAGTLDLPSVYMSICLSVCRLKSGSKDKQGSLMKLGMRTGGNVLIMHVIFLRCCMKIVVTMVMEMR